MIKSVFAATAVLFASAGAALAGPYVNVETNAGWAGDDYSGAVTDLHVGYEGALGDSAGWYIQGGPAFVLPDGGDSSTELSGKVGIGVPVTDKLGVYGELAAITAGEIDFDEDLSVNLKAGIKYSF